MSLTHGVPHQLSKEEAIGSQALDRTSARWSTLNFANFTGARASAWLTSEDSSLGSDGSLQVGSEMDYAKVKRVRFSDPTSASSLVVDRGSRRRVELRFSGESEFSGFARSRLHNIVLSQDFSSPKSLQSVGPTLSMLSSKEAGEKLRLKSDIINDTEALHTAAQFLTRKFGQSPGAYDKWCKWLLPVCDPEKRKQSISSRFEIEYRINVNDYERSTQPIAKRLRRNIRQLLHKDYAPVNNRVWHEKLGKLLIEKNSVDLTDHIKRLEEREKRRHVELLQKGVIKQDDVDQSHQQLKKPKKTVPQNRDKKATDRLNDLLVNIAETGTDVLAPDLTNLKRIVAKNTAELNEAESDSETAEFDASVPLLLLKEWLKGTPEYLPRHKIPISPGGRCPRALKLQELPQREKKLFSDERRWDEWVRNEELSSDDSARIFDDGMASKPVPAGGMKELYAKARAILTSACFIRKKNKNRQFRRVKT